MLIRELTQPSKRCSEQPLTLEGYSSMLLAVPLKFFWRMLCGAFRRRWVRWLTYILVPTLGLLWAGYAFVTRYSCTNPQSEAYLEALCKNYSKGLITGSLCEPLCVTKEIHFQRCLGHGVKWHVLLAEWDGENVILKTPKPPGEVALLSYWLGRSKMIDNKDVKITKQRFIHQANKTTFINIAGDHYSEATLKTLQDIFQECDVHGDGILNFDELVTCWQLVETDEYVLYSFLKGELGIPQLCGTCGNLYAVEYAPEPFYLAKSRTWKFSVELALALLDVVEVIEKTPYGTLHLCDVQESNFGVNVREDGRVLAKLIDVDLSMFEETLLFKIEHGKDKPCMSDFDCSHFDCLVRCQDGKCSGKLESNNLMNLCRKIFQQHPGWHSAHLLDPPESIKPQLEELLQQCSTPGLSYISKALMEKLRSLLRSSIDL